MRNFIYFIALLYLTICSTSFVLAQIDTFLIKETNSYVKYIDSISNSDNIKNIDFKTLIEDGVIRQDGQTVGGYGIYTLTNSNNDSVFRIEYNGGVSINVNKTYYYKFNKLIFARLQLTSHKNGYYRVYDKTEYYSEGKMVKAAITKESKASNYTTEINLSLFQDGMKLLDDFNKDYTHRQ